MTTQDKPADEPTKDPKAVEIVVYPVVPVVNIRSARARYARES